MKKLAGLLAAVLVFVATAVTLSPSQEVQAFSSSELDYSGSHWYRSSKAGAPISFYFNLNYETQRDIDITGWKAALCPMNNVSLEGATVAFDLTNDNRYVSEAYNSASISLYTSLPSDIPEGPYKQAVFDANGNLQFEGYSAAEYINKSLVSVSCDMMNNDGYAYAYVYGDNLPLSAATYPTLYAADKQTAVTSFSDYATEVNEYGETVHIYRLNILDASQFALEEGVACLYYKVGTPNVSVSDSDAVNDGGIGLYSSDANGFGWLYAFNLNDYVQRHNMNVTVTNPFAQTGSADNNTSSETGNNSGNTGSTDSNTGSDSGNSTVGTASTQTPAATATLNGQSVAVTVSSMQNSEVPEVQASINSLISWTNQIASRPAEVADVLNQYAPAMNITGVVAGGTLELTVPSGTDISSGVRITFTDSSIASNVRSGDKVVVLHVKQDGSIEYLPAEAGDGTISATFTSLSPVAWYKVSTNSGSNAVSPKTGFSFWEYLWNLFR